MAGFCDSRHNVFMDRFDELFADLEGQAAAEAAREREGEYGDLVAESFYEVTFVERLAGAVGQHVHLRTASGAVSGTLVSVGEGCCCLEGEVLVMLAAVEGAALRPREHAVQGRWRSARSILGQWCAQRAQVRVETAGASLEGLLHAVARDYLQLRRRGVFDLVPLRRISVVRILR